MQVEYWPISRIKLFSPPAIPEESIASAMQAISRPAAYRTPSSWTATRSSCVVASATKQLFDLG